jgi:hypothetical protein
MGRISFQKRQKEMKRQEKRQMKAEKRAQRKLDKDNGVVPQDESALELLEQPEQTDLTEQTEEPGATHHAD